jgi:hypothetical protein
MLANPAVSVALLQMGAALSAGRSAPEAMADTAGAVGRVGMMSEKYRQQQTLEEAGRRKEGREDRRLGLEERELGAREKLWEMQAKNYERMARGGGGGGGGGGAGGATMSTDQAKAMYDECLKIPGSTPQSCMAAVQKKMYGLTPSQYVGGEESFYAMKLDQDRVADLEKRRDELQFLNKDLSADDLAELNRLKARKAWTPTQAVPQMPPPGGARTANPPNATASSPFDAASPQRVDFKSEAEASEAFSTGSLKVGTKIFVNGKHVATVTP